MINSLSYLCSSYGRLVLDLNALERITEYLEEPPQEPVGGTVPPALWPSSTCQGPLIRFEEVFVSYDKNLPPVLSDVTFDVKPGERIGSKRLPLQNTDEMNQTHFARTQSWDELARENRRSQRPSCDSLSSLTAESWSTGSVRKVTEGCDGRTQADTRIPSSTFRRSLSMTCGNASRICHKTLLSSKGPCARISTSSTNNPTKSVFVCWRTCTCECQALSIATWSCRRQSRPEDRTSLPDSGNSSRWLERKTLFPVAVGTHRSRFFHSSPGFFKTAVSSCLMNRLHLSITHSTKGSSKWFEKSSRAQQSSALRTDCKPACAPFRRVSVSSDNPYHTGSQFETTIASWYWRTGG